MIDWLKTKVPFPHPPIRGGAFLVVNPAGEVETEKALPMSVKGSFESNMSVCSYGSDGNGLATHLIISGNPSKFLQGHNVIGTDDIHYLFNRTLEKLCIALDIDYEFVPPNLVEVKWIDINYMFELSSIDDVRAWLAAAEFSARSRSGRAVAKGSTVYIQKNSRRWAFKFYSKYDELARFPLPDGLHDSGLVAFSEKLLRAEARFFAKELQRIGVFHLSDLNPDRIRKIFGDYMQKITLTDRVRLPYREAMELPSNLRSTYALWHDGHDMRTMLSKSSFYRNRSALLNHGIDISMSAPTNRANNVIPLFRTLTAAEVQIPAWAYERKLIAGGN